jgi:Cytochrome P460
MDQDSKKSAATGAWGFADFKGGKPGDKALHETCFSCHEPAKDRDLVFTHYAPWRSRQGFKIHASPVTDETPDPTGG